MHTPQWQSSCRTGCPSASVLPQRWEVLCLGSAPACGEGCRVAEQCRCLMAQPDEHCLLLESTRRWRWLPQPHQLCKTLIKCCNLSSEWLMNGFSCRNPGLWLVNFALPHGVPRYWWALQQQLGERGLCQPVPVSLVPTDSLREFSSRAGTGYVTEEIWKKAGEWVMVPWHRGPAAHLAQGALLAGISSTQAWMCSAESRDAQVQECPGTCVLGSPLCLDPGILGWPGWERP